MKTAPAPAMDDYQAEGDFHTLSRAEEIKADAKRHEKALSHGKQKVAAMQAVVDPEGAGDADANGMKEGSKAEEAADAKEAKLPQRGARTTMHKPKATPPAKRVPRANSSSVI